MPIRARRGSTIGASGGLREISWRGFRFKTAKKTDSFLEVVLRYPHRTEQFVQFHPDQGAFGTKTYAPGVVTGVETEGFRSNAPAGPYSGFYLKDTHQGEGDTHRRSYRRPASRNKVCRGRP